MVSGIIARSSMAIMFFILNIFLTFAGTMYFGCISTVLHATCYMNVNYGTHTYIHHSCGVTCHSHSTVGTGTHVWYTHIHKIIKYTSTRVIKYKSTFIHSYESYM